MSTASVITQPRPLMRTTISSEWSSGICDCFKDLPSCCFAFWCFPCFTCVTARNAGQCLCLPLLDGYGCIPPIATSLRVLIRQRYGIEDSICNDCVYTFFCGTCSWCQMAREMKLRSNPITFVNSRALS